MLEHTLIDIAPHALTLTLWYYIRSTICVQTALLSRGRNPFDVYIKCYCGRWGKMSLRGVYPQLGVQTADWLRQTRSDTWAPLLSLFTANLLVSHWDSSNIEWPQFPCREKKRLGRVNERADEQKRLLPRKREVNEMAGTVNDGQEVQVG